VHLQLTPKLSPKNSAFLPWGRTCAPSPRLCLWCLITSDNIKKLNSADKIYHSLLIIITKDVIAPHGIRFIIKAHFICTKHSKINELQSLEIHTLIFFLILHPNATATKNAKSINRYYSVLVLCRWHTFPSSSWQECTKSQH